MVATMLKRLAALMAVYRWMKQQPNNTMFFAESTEDGRAFLIAPVSDIQIPAFYVLDAPGRPIDEPFTRRCEDGQYGWYVRNASNGYTFLMPAMTGIWEQDRKQAGVLRTELEHALTNVYGGIDDREPNVTPHPDQFDLSLKG